MINLKPNKKYNGIFYTHRKVLHFQNNRDYISDNDILDLFLGLVKLIKKSTEVKLEEKYISIINSLKREVEFLKKSNIKK